MSLSPHHGVAKAISNGGDSNPRPKRWDGSSSAQVHRAAKTSSPTETRCPVSSTAPQVPGPCCGGPASLLPVELEPPLPPVQEEKERRSRAQPGAAAALSSTPAPLAVQEEKERRSRVGVESSSSWSRRRCCSAFDGSSMAVRDEEGGPVHSVCGRRSLATFLDHSRDELQFSVAICVIDWRRIWCSTVLQTMHFEFGARFESSVGDSLACYAFICTIFFNLLFSLSSSCVCVCIFILYS
jgi:hypothetical protein